MKQKKIKASNTCFTLCDMTIFVFTFGVPAKTRIKEEHRIVA